MIHWGIVGIGGFAATWVRTLQALEAQGSARLAASAERDTVRYASEAAALDARGCPVYSSLDALLAEHRGPLDVIGLPVGIPYHAPLAVQAMRAGYHVLLEKPLAGSVQDVWEIAEASRQTGRWCCVGYQWLHSPTIRWIANHLLTGRLGPVIEARALVGWPRPAAYYARTDWAGALRIDGRWVLDGPATNATAHHLTNLLYLASQNEQGIAEIESVRAELYRAKPIASYDTSAIEIRLKNGPRLLHLCSHAVMRTQEPIMQILCGAGTITWSATNDTATVHWADGAEESYANPHPEDNAAGPISQAVRVVAGLDPSPLCGLEQAAPQGLAVNLAFESSGGITTVPAAERTETVLGASPLVAIRGLEEILQAGYPEGKLPSELGVPWAVPSETVAAEGYLAFPRDRRLARQLGCQPG
ncbi:MAG: Gfo/Idh/MocA family protein [Anaerolineae bacterium]